MKKLVAVLLTVMMLMSLTTALAADDEFKEIPAILTAVLDYSADEWYSSSTNRALLTVLVLGDFAVSDDPIAVEIVEPSYVAYDKSIDGLIILFKGDGEYVLANYNRFHADKIKYMRTGLTSSVTAELLLDSLEHPYQQNSLAELGYVANQLAEILTK